MADLPVFRKVLVFVASPSGLDAEHTAIDSLTKRLNSLLAGWLVEIEITRGAHHGPSGQRPQDDINRDVDTCEIFVGLVWTHIGAPSGSGHESGFLEEYERLRDRRGSNRWPELLVCFKRIDQAQLDDPGPKLKKVLNFKQTFIDSHRPFFFEYEAIEDLEERLTKRLFELVVERTGLGPEPESLQGERGKRPLAPTGSDLPPLSTEALPSEDPRLVIDGPLTAVPDGGVSEDLCRHDRTGVSCLQPKRSLLFEREL